MAVIMRILLVIGAYGKVADKLGGNKSTTLALRLKRFPGPYISAIIAPRSISTVGSADRLGELSYLSSC